jgi:hypothetical protein
MESAINPHFNEAPDLLHAPNPLDCAQQRFPRNVAAQ